MLFNERSAPILQIVTTKGTIDLLMPPFYLRNWRPATASIKADGIWSDSPLLDYRRLVIKQRGAATERIDVVLSGRNPDAEAERLAMLIDAMEMSSDFFTKRNISTPVYLVVRPRGATNKSYAVIYSGTVEGLENPFAQPYNQRDGRALQSELAILLERGDWRAAPPGERVDRSGHMAQPVQNAIPDGGFEVVGRGTTGFTQYNSPTYADTFETKLAYSGKYVYRVSATSGAGRGGYRDITGLSEGVDYTISAKYYVLNGGAYLGAWDGGGFTNVVSQSATTRNTGNLITNGGFESDLSGWNTWGASVATRSNAQAYAGTWSMRVDVSGSSKFSHGSVWSDAAIIPEGTTKLYASWAFLLSSPQSYFTRELFLVFTETPMTAWDQGLEGQDAVVLPVFGAANKETALSLDYNEWSAATDWEYHVEAYASVPQGANYVYFVLYHERQGAGGAGTETVYLDDITVYATVPLEGAYNNWQELSITKTCPVGGSIRVGMISESSLTSEFYVDEIEVGLEFGDVPDGQTWPKLSNFHGDFQLSCAWYYDDSSAQFTDVMEQTSFPYELFPSTLATDDILYFGILRNHVGSTTLWNAPFSNVVFNLQSSLDATGVTIDWQYYNGSAWVSFDTIDDNTDGFTRTGINAVAWAVPSTMTFTTINSESGWFVRAVFTAVGTVTSVPLFRAPFPHIVNKNYVEVADDALSGTLDSLLRLDVQLHGGPVGFVTEQYEVISSTDDVSWDEALQTGSLTEGVSVVAVGGEKNVAVRFGSVTIPDGVSVLEARLYFTAGTTGTSSGDALIRVRHEHEANPDTFSGANPGAIYTNAALRDWRLEGTYPHLVDGEYVNDNPGESILIGDITPHIESLIDDAGFQSGDAMAFMLSWDDTGSGQIYMDTYNAFSTSTFTLEILYLGSNDRVAGAVISSRSVDRGEDFRSQINIGKRGESITQLALYFTEFRAGTEVHGSVLPSGSYGRVILPPGTELTDMCLVSIDYPLSAQYGGNFRAFIRCGKGADTDDDVWVRLAYQCGSASEKIYSKPVRISIANMQLADMGPVLVPDTGIDALVFTIQASNTSATTTTFLELYTLILMPSDEMVCEYSTIAGSPYGVIVPQHYLSIDGTEEYKQQRTATIQRGDGKGVVSNAMVAGTLPRLDQRSEQRLYLLTYSNVGISKTNPAIQYVSYTNTLHAMRVGVVNRHSSLRGPLGSVWGPLS